MPLLLYICVHPKRIHRLALGCAFFFFISDITCIILHLFKRFPDLISFYMFSGFEGITFYLLDSLLIHIQVVWCFAFAEANLL